ncbi:hypothetical protein [Gordonia sp. (in: high G+C Gram-positive bacteria)]|uniref:hypothetical protein n=1 Tax=Gordonia sp. (in: high G+C Gram-positive bacteria) TaxID=84139 RepID=UPI0039E6335F
MIRLDEILALQDGVLTRVQALAGGLTEAELRTKLRREWVRLHPGVYITHTGPPTWRQRAWAAVAGLPQSALSHQSALCAAGLGSPSGPIHVAVGRKCHAPDRPGVRIHRYARLEEHAWWHTLPPRIRVEHALLDVAGEATTQIDAIASLADAVQARVTSVGRIRHALSERTVCRRRKLIAEVLTDIAEGTCSVLEHGYLTRVERPHGLPKPLRQAPTRAGRRGLHDVEYRQWGLIVELDGRFAHDTARARDRDLERDLDAAARLDRRTVRLGWGQVFERPCSTAEKIGALLQTQGWTGVPTSCGECELPRITAP